MQSDTLGYFLAKSRFPKLLKILKVELNLGKLRRRSICAQGRCATKLRYAPTEFTLHHVEYEYRIGTRTYRSSRLAFQDAGYASYKKASMALGRSPAGQPISVFHDPANPQRAVLERKAPGDRFPLVVGTIMVLVAIASRFKR